MKAEAADLFEHNLTHRYTKPVYDPRGIRNYTYQSADNPVRRPIWKLGGMEQKLHLKTKKGEDCAVTLVAENEKELQTLRETVQGVATAEAAFRALRGEQCGTNQKLKELAHDTSRRGRVLLSHFGVSLPL